MIYMDKVNLGIDEVHRLLELERHIRSFDKEETDG